MKDSSKVETNFIIVFTQNHAPSPPYSPLIKIPYLMLPWETKCDVMIAFHDYEDSRKVFTI